MLHRKATLRMAAALLWHGGVSSLTPATGRTVILVRHGAVDRVAGGVPPSALYGGDIDVPLSARGKAEARAAADFVGREWADKVQSVWTSPLVRAVYGAELVARAVGTEQPVFVEESFREIRRGDWLRKTPEEIQALTPGGMATFLADPDYRPPGGAESINDVQARALAALDQRVLKGLHVGSAAVLVSHLYVTRAILSSALPGVPIPDIDVPTASIAVLVFPPPGQQSTAPVVLSRGFKPDLDPRDEARLAAGDSEV